MATAVSVQLGAALSDAKTVADAVTLRRCIVQAAQAALLHEGVRSGELSITLLDDDEMRELNARFLEHDSVTDVIAFPLYADGERPVGDIYIGFPQVDRQAAEHGIDRADELARVTVHGTLHVLGYDHPAGIERLDSEMWRVQETILQQLQQG